MKLKARCIKLGSRIRISKMFRTLVIIKDSRLIMDLQLLLEDHRAVRVHIMVHYSRITIILREAKAPSTVHRRVMVRVTTVHRAVRIYIMVHHGVTVRIIIARITTVHSVVRIHIMVHHRVMVRISITIVHREVRTLVLLELLEVLQVIFHVQEVRHLFQMLFLQLLILFQEMDRDQMLMVVVSILQNLEVIKPDFGKELSGSFLFLLFFCKNYILKKKRKE